MDYVVVGGDERYAQLARLLKKRGKRVGLWGREPVPGVPTVEKAELKTAKCLIAGCPAKVKDGILPPEALLKRMGDGAKLTLCGPKHPTMGDDRVIDLWADEALIRENAALTAEGAVSAAMRASTRALCDMRCLIIGWGRIGRALTERLSALGTAVTVASRRSQGRNSAVERGAEAVDTHAIADVVSGFDLICNTAPEMVLDEAALGKVDRDAMIIDLASPPYGVDLHAAWKLGLRAWREPALPGRYCPESAAMALLRSMARQGIL
ncbi:MAG: NAD(P)-dependent oxidoreductase [Clostridia bacterium]|nr:NAD(P)-dependent oxidoreductase [Clostridia bacterium]